MKRAGYRQFAAMKVSAVKFFLADIVHAMPVGVPASRINAHFAFFRLTAAILPSTAHTAAVSCFAYPCAIAAL